MKTSNWKLLQKTQRVHLNSAIHEYHRLTQLIALAGKHLIPERSDDSNTSLSWSREKWVMMGETIPESNESRFILDPDSMNISLVTKDQSVLGTFDPVNRLKSESIQQMNIILNEAGIAGMITDDLHYNISEDISARYIMPTSVLKLKHLHLRHNAEYILSKIAAKYNGEEQNRIWPHHFDTGNLIKINEQNDSTKASLGIGLAIADKFHPSPYFYVNFWSENEELNKKNLPSLKNIGEKIEQNWKGYLLGTDIISEFDNAENQFEQVEVFFDESIQTLRNLLTSN